MSLVAAFFMIVLSGWVVAGVTSDALAARGKWVWLAVPVAAFGSLVISFTGMLGLSYLGLVGYEGPPQGFGEHSFGAWVATSWTAVLGIPIVLATATRIVIWELDDREAAGDV